MAVAPDAPHPPLPRSSRLIRLSQLFHSLRASTVLSGRHLLIVVAMTAIRLGMCNRLPLSVCTTTHITCIYKLCLLTYTFVYWHTYLCVVTYLTLVELNLLSKIRIYLSAFGIIREYWDGAGNWNASSLTTRSYRSYIVSTTAADVLAPYVARASATMILTWLCRNVVISAPTGLTISCVKHTLILHDVISTYECSLPVCLRRIWCL